MDKPKLHLWETGVIRITRHPQCFGQFLWCAAHCLWIGNSFMITTSAGLMAHHLFSCWHGDFRQRRKYGEVGSQTLSTALQVVLQHFAAAHSAAWKCGKGGLIRALHCCGFGVLLQCCGCCCSTLLLLAELLYGSALLCP